ncbi:hypothetical protein AVEN_168659-1, partial [Araneus ventricosus]
SLRHRLLPRHSPIHKFHSFLLKNFSKEKSKIEIDRVKQRRDTLPKIADTFGEGLEKRFEIVRGNDTLGRIPTGHKAPTTGVARGKSDRGTEA